MWEAPGGMPNANDFNRLFITPNAVNDPIRTANYFAQICLSKFRHETTNFGKGCQTFGSGNEFVADALELCLAIYWSISAKSACDEEEMITFQPIGRSWL
jgi:hypothetical protein